jgi:2-dehydro-3-deoxyphosphogluconate aldolase/(4S)-4-hydroxy-2-oxoglutarate aldolase
MEGNPMTSANTTSPAAPAVPANNLSPGAASASTSDQAGVLAAVMRSRVLPVLVIEDADRAVPLAESLIAGGLPCAEVTFRTAAAPDALRSMARIGDLAVGAGTVLTASQANVAIDCGARYVVTPGFSAEVIMACQRRGIPVIPGIATAMEAMMALDAGLTLVKLFPAEIIGGVAAVRALAGPFPMLRFIPTGGIDLNNLRSYLSQPAVAAIGGSWIATKRLVSEGRFGEIEALARAAVEVVRSMDTER